MGQPAGPGFRNQPAFVSLCCGISSLVPWIIVLTLPLALVFGVAGLVRSAALPDRQGRTAALMGMGVGLAALALHLALAGLATLIGFL